MAPTAIVTVLAVLIALGPAAIAATPLPDLATGVLFRRSCAECDVGMFCEYGYPGTPEGGVACVAYAEQDAHSLFRRYLGDTCSGAGLGAFKQCDPTAANAAYRVCDTSSGAFSTSINPMGVCIPDGSSFCCVNADTWKTVANPCSNAAEPLCLTPGSELVAFADSSETIPCQAAQNGIVVVGATGSCAAPSGLSQTEGLVAGCCKPFVGTTCMTSFKTCPPGVGSGRACMLATGDVSDAGDNSNGACLPQTGADACCVDFAEFEGSTADNCNGVLCRDQNYDPPRFLVNRPGVSFTCNPNNGELDEFFTWGCDPSRGEGFIATCCTVAPSG